MLDNQVRKLVDTFVYVVFLLVVECLDGKSLGTLFLFVHRPDNVDESSVNECVRKIARKLSANTKYWSSESYCFNIYLRYIFISFQHKNYKQ